MTLALRASLSDWLAAAGRDRDTKALRRTLRPRQHDDRLLDLAGNDYLGLARDLRVVEAAVDAARRWGAGATASRLVTGTTQLHADLEAALAAFTGAESALVFSTGYAANLGVVTALAGADAMVVSDAANHASIVDACRLATSPVTVTPHLDLVAVDRALATRDRPRALVVTDSVFSTDGALAPLVELHAICRSHDAVLVVDEAHALGVAGPGGRGLAVAAGIAGEPDVVRTVTLSKALGSQGGAVLGTGAMTEHLLNTARTFIFDTGLAPPAAGAALCALRLLEADPRLADRVRSRAVELAAALDAPTPSAAVVSVVLGSPDRAVEAATACREAGVLVGCFRPPTVLAGTSRLRVTARADLTDDDVATAAAVIRAAVAGASRR